MVDLTFGVHRPITIEARLYLNGKYQTFAKERATIQGGPDDPDLAAAVANLTQDLLSRSDAYRSVHSRHIAGRPTQSRH
jgi:hypothetical protein